jgi:hypothetical protein
LVDGLGQERVDSLCLSIQQNESTSLAVQAHEDTVEVLPDPQPDLMTPRRGASERLPIGALAATKRPVACDVVNETEETASLFVREPEDEVLCWLQVVSISVELHVEDTLGIIRIPFRLGYSLETISHL